MSFSHIPPFIHTSLLNKNKEELSICPISDVKEAKEKVIPDQPQEIQQLLDQESPKVYYLWNHFDSHVQMYKGYTKDFRKRLRSHNQWVGNGQSSKFTSTMLKKKKINQNQDVVLSPVCVITGFKNSHQALAFEYRVKHFKVETRNKLNQKVMEQNDHLAFELEPDFFEALDARLKHYFSTSKKKYPFALQQLFYTLTMLQFSENSDPVDMLHVHWFEVEKFWDMTEWGRQNLFLTHIFHSRVSPWIDEYLCLQRSNEKKGCLDRHGQKRKQSE